MRKISVDRLIGNEIIAKDVFTENGIIIVPKGKIISESEIKGLQKLHIDSVFIEDAISAEIDEDQYSEHIICEKCTDKFNSTLNKFSFGHDSESDPIFELANDVLENVLKKEEVLYNVSQVRRKDNSLSEHCVSVTALSLLVAIKAKMSKEQLNDIAVGALLHDVGFTLMQQSYQDMQNPDASDDLKKDIRRHPVVGYMNVETQSWLTNVSKDIILYHHERVDGMGFPFKLKGSRIKPEVSIVSICDAFDNIIYGNFEHKMKVYEVMEYLTAMSGKRFDMEFANIFISSVAAYPIGTIVMTNSGLKCIVVRQNNSAPTRPVIKEVNKNDNGEWQLGKEHDLLDELTLFIVDTVEE